MARSLTVAARILFLLVTGHWSLVTVLSAQGIITTVAGNGRVFRGDGGLAIRAQMGLVQGVAADSVGNVYATDQTDNVVVRISPAGIIRVVAGNNIAGFSGDGGPATSASLNFGSLGGVAVDAAGNLYIADTANNRVRKVSPDGTISTFAGGGSRFGVDGIPATSAGLSYPVGVAVNAAGDVFIGELLGNRIRKVSPNGIIATVAGNGTAGFSGDGGPAPSASLNNPRGIALDSAGSIYIADFNNHRIRKITPVGIMNTVAGTGTPSFGSSGDGGAATSASVSSPSGVAVDAAGNLYIVDSLNSRIRKVSPAGIITNFAGGAFYGFSGDGGPATNAGLRAPTGLAVVGGNLYIADTGNGRIRRVDPSGNIGTVAGIGLVNFSGDGGPATGASLSNPESVEVDATGNLYIADTGGNRIRKVSSAGVITTAAGNGTPAFSGDGGPATQSSLDGPRGVAVDTAGNLYITDWLNERIRKVSPVGTITTVAGNGKFAFSGDGGPATAASFANEFMIDVDSAGNLYIADENNNRIRKVSPSAIITTVAGSGPAPTINCPGGFSGDGGLATSATLNCPGGVAVDAAGNLYISDAGNGRIRKVTPDGIIRTVAGGGSFFVQDGIPATSASLGLRGGIAVDLAGNLYFGSGDRIRKVSPDGIITTVAGGGISGYAGDGGPATSASLNSPYDVAVDAAGNLYIADRLNDRIRKVLASPPSFAIAPANLSFTAQTGTGTVLPQRLTITSPVTGLAWGADVATESGGNWLSVSPFAGSMPSVVDVRVDVTNLTPGVYLGTLTIVSPLAAVPIQSVAVNLTVEVAPAAKLAVEPGSLTFETLVGGTPPANTLRVSNAGGGSLNWVARAETSSGGNWLSVTPASGTVSAAASNQVQVAASSSTLAAGVYSGAVVVDSATTGETLRVPVSLLISQSRQTILVSQSGLLFTAVEGGNLIAPQTFGVLNTGEGVMLWTAQASTLAGGNWLTVTPREGTSDAASLRVPLVNVAVNVAGLAAGQYSGLIRLNAPTANNSPQFVTVELNVLPRGSNPGVLVRPTGLIFAAQAGTSSPGSQTVNLGTVVPGNVDVVSGLLTRDGASWLEAVPRNLTLSAGDAIQRIVVQPTLGSFAPGVYRGALTFLFSDSTPAQVVNILFLVVSRAVAGAGTSLPNRSAGPSPASRDRDDMDGMASGGELLGSDGRGVDGLESEPRALASGVGPAADGCAPTQLHATHRTLGTNFASPVGWPSTIEAQVADDCGNTVPNATVVARFSNGDPLVVLTSLRNGLYVGTWRPVNPTGQVTVTVRAELPPLAPVEVQAQGQVSANATAPALNAGGIVNAASFARGEGLAPGSIVAVFGRNLARGENYASRVPLEKTLGGATLNIGGIEAPLFFSSEGQINAQVPIELTPNTRPHTVARTTRQDGTQTLTVPETITIAVARPAIFTTNQQGSGQGAILNQNFSPNSAANAAARGSVIQIFATGLGPTNPVVASGTPAPSSPAAVVTNGVTATIGGVNAAVQFAGLAPGFVGLYQVNVTIPAGVAPDPEVPLVLLQNGVPSNNVTLAVR
ncbi:MAG: hypothetical protein A3J28_06665 [Acidobacteria bacterium RIFCSPLOWO2_12_FULL_60_22]|nr:MAG: hypothetical protein A3J28_06665 [Acidobacteria bacterium RIFCSPLOWO2_12_FULL_60_22]